MDSEQIWVLTERVMHNADTGNILYDSMHSNTKSQDSIDFITYLINILHCQHHIVLYLSVLIFAKHYCKLYHFLQCQCSFLAAQSQFNSGSHSCKVKLRLLAVSLAVLLLQKTIPLTTQQRQTAHKVVIFYSPLIYLLSCLEKKEQIVCFAEASFISHRRKRPLILSCHTSYTLIMQALLEDERKQCTLSPWQMTHEALTGCPL